MGSTALVLFGGTLPVSRGETGENYPECTYVNKVDTKSSFKLHVFHILNKQPPEFCSSDLNECACIIPRCNVFKNRVVSGF